MRQVNGTRTNGVRAGRRAYASAPRGRACSRRSDRSAWLAMSDVHKNADRLPAARIGSVAGGFLGLWWAGKRGVFDQKQVALKIKRSANFPLTTLAPGSELRGTRRLRGDLTASVCYGGPSTEARRESRAARRVCLPRHLVWSGSGLGLGQGLGLGLGLP